MDSPLFLDKQTIIELHEYQISFFGGDFGLSDEGLLESATYAPINYFNYTPIKNLFDLSACYAFHLVKNHPFVDGNKRVALSAALAFLKINGILISIKQPVIFKAVRNLATSKIDKLKFAEILEKSSPVEFSFVADLYLEEQEKEIRRRLISRPPGTQ